MALLKTMQDEKGIQTAYHRISGVSMLGELALEVKSYTAQTYREQEKEQQALLEQQQEIQRRLEEEMAKTGEDYSRETIEQLTEQNNAIGFPQGRDLSVFTRHYTFPLNKTDPLTYAGFYARLKEQPEFEAAQDI